MKLSLLFGLLLFSFLFIFKLNDFEIFFLEKIYELEFQG